MWNLGTLHIVSGEKQCSTAEAYPSYSQGGLAARPLEMRDQQSIRSLVDRGVWSFPAFPLLLSSPMSLEWHRASIELNGESEAC